LQGFTPAAPRKEFLQLCDLWFGYEVVRVTQDKTPITAKYVRQQRTSFATCLGHACLAQLVGALQYRIRN